MNTLFILKQLSLVFVFAVAGILESRSSPVAPVMESHIKNVGTFLGLQGPEAGPKSESSASLATLPGSWHPTGRFKRDGILAQSKIVLKGLGNAFETHGYEATGSSVDPQEAALGSDESLSTANDITPGSTSNEEGYRALPGTENGIVPRSIVRRDTDSRPTRWAADSKIVLEKRRNSLASRSVSASSSTGEKSILHEKESKSHGFDDSKIVLARSTA